MTVGSRAQVFHGGADKTTGGLRKKDLYKNKRGRIVSLKKSKTAKSWNPLKMLGLLSKSGEPFGARTYRKGTISKTRRGTSGQRVQDFVTHKGTMIKRFGKKIKAYSRKRFKRFGKGGGSLGYSNYPGDVPNFHNRDMSAQMQALHAASGGSRHRGGGLNMTPINQAYAPSTNNIDFGNNSPLSRALNAGA